MVSENIVETGEEIKEVEERKGVHCRKPENRWLRGSPKL